MYVRYAMALMALLGLAMAPLREARAADTLRVGKAVPIWAFLALDIGVEQGIYAKYDIALDISDMGNAAKLHQALTAGSLDLGLTSGADLAFPAKGAPERTIAAFATAPLSVTVMVAYDSPIKGVADLKGTTLAIPGVGSSPEWLVHQMSSQEGWGADGVKTVALGSMAANIAALKAHQIAGIVGSSESAYPLEDAHEGRIIAHLADFAPHFHAHIIVARNELIADKPQVIERFLKGFFASIAYIKHNRAATNEAAAKLMHEPVAVMDRVYGDQIAMLEDDGHFDPQAIEVLKQSFVDLGTLPAKPSDDQILTTRFVPVKP